MTVINPRKIVELGVVTGLINPERQIAQHGIDLSVKKIELMTDGILYITDHERRLPPYIEAERDEYGRYILQPHKAYSITFNEYVKVPKGMMGWILNRSSYLRGGCQIHSAIYDANFQNFLNAFAFPRVKTIIQKNARVAQIIFWEASEASLYDGYWQDREVKK